MITDDQCVMYGFCIEKHWKKFIISILNLWFINYITETIVTQNTLSKQILVYDEISVRIYIIADSNSGIKYSMTLYFKLPPGWHLIRWEKLLMVIKATDRAASAFLSWNLLNYLLKTIFQGNVSQVQC